VLSVDYVYVLIWIPRCFFGSIAVIIGFDGFAGASYSFIFWCLLMISFLEDIHWLVSGIMDMKLIRDIFQYPINAVFLSNN